jgi:putative nucleotidyltransferase with HDIG domain
MSPFSQLPPRARAYLFGWWALGAPTVLAAMVFCSGVAVLPAALRFPGVPAPPAAAVLLPLLLLAYSMSGKRVILTPALAGPGSGGSMNVAFVSTYTVLLCLGPWPAVLAAAAGEVGRGTLGAKKHRWFQVLFNVASVSVATALAAWVYLRCSGGCGVDLLPAGTPARTAFSALDLGTWCALMASILVFYAVNTFSVAAILALHRGEALVPLWRSSFLWTAPGYFAAASAAGLTRAAYIGMGSAGFLTGLPILYLIYQSYRIYLEKVEQQKKHIERLKVEQQKLEEVYHSALESLALAIDAKDKYTRKHISRVQVYAEAIARRLQVGQVDLQAIRTAALLHDIGKLAVPEQILVKPGKLTAEEWKRMQSHVTTGAMMLEPVAFPWPVIPIVLTHHERWDGNGYPKGLKGEKIPLGGRIVGLADFFDAVTSDRPYHRAMSPEEAMAKVRAGCGTQFDPRVVEAFFAIYESVQDQIAAINAAATRFSGTPATDPGEPSPDEQRHNLLFVLDEIGRASDELYTLYETVQPLGRSLDLGETLHVIVEKTASLVPFDTCALFWLTEDGSELRAEITAGLYRERLEGMTIKVGEGLSGWVAMHGKAILNKPASMDIARKLRPQDEIELNSSLVVPLVLDGRTVGTISLYSGARQDFYTAEHLRLLTIVADHAVTAVENARQFERTRELAMTDALTGLPNARALAWRLTREIEACGREGRPLALVLIDMDNFKVVNDRLGHVAGDRALRDVAEILVREACNCGLGSAECGLESGLSSPSPQSANPNPQSAIESGPFVSRYAGDEFVAVLPGVTRQQARAIAAGIRRRLAEYRLSETLLLLPENWDAPARDTGERRGDGAPRRSVLSEARVAWSGASAGVALFPEDAADPRALIHCADQRMYRDKFARKRVTERQASGVRRPAALPAAALRPEDGKLVSSTRRAPLS